MSDAKMQACLKSGKSRAACMKQCYPEGAPGKGGKKKQAPPFKKGG